MLFPHWSAVLDNAESGSIRCAIQNLTSQKKVGLVARFFLSRNTNI